MIDLIKNLNETSYPILLDNGTVLTAKDWRLKEVYLDRENNCYLSKEEFIEENDSYQSMINNCLTNIENLKNNFKDVYLPQYIEQQIKIYNKKIENLKLEQLEWKNNLVPTLVLCNNLSKTKEEYINESDSYCSDEDNFLKDS